MYWVWLHWGQYQSTMTERDERELRGLVRAMYSLEPMRTYLEKSPNLHTLDPEFVAFVRDALADDVPVSGSAS